MPSFWRRSKERPQEEKRLSEEMLSTQIRKVRQNLMPGFFYYFSHNFYNLCPQNFPTNKKMGLFLFRFIFYD